MKRKSPTPMDEAQVNGSSFVRVSVGDQSPVAAIPQTKRDPAKGVSPLNFSRPPNNELDRSLTSPRALRSPGLTTNRSGKIVQSGTLNRAATMNSVARNKSSDQLIQQVSTLSSQNQRSTDTRREVGGLSGTAVNRDTDANEKAITLDRSWRTKEADFTENLPQVGGTFSFDLERDAQVFFDWINTFEENGADSSRLNTTPMSEGNHTTMISSMAWQKSSPRSTMRVQRVACDVLGFDEKHVQSENCTTETPGCSKASILDQKPHPELHEVSVRLPTTELQEFDKRPPQTFQEMASGFYKVDSTPDRTQVLAYDFTKVDQTSACSQKFTSDAGENPGYNPSLNGLLNDTSLSYGTGKTGVQFDHRALPSFRSAGLPVGHVGVSVQRGYASDSEDQMDWLEQQKAKLKMKRCREDPTTSTRPDPMFLQELKSRQRILSRTPNEEKESLGYLISTGRAQNSKIATKSADLYYMEYRHRIPTPDLYTGWPDSYSSTKNYDPRVDEWKGTPNFELNRAGQFAKESQSPGEGDRSYMLSRRANEVPLSNCQSSLTACSLNSNRTTNTKTESVKGFSNGNGHTVKGTYIEPSSSDQQEVHETCFSKKISHQHRGYSPTRMDALVSASVTVDCESSPSSSRSTERSDSGYTTASASSTNDEFPLTRFRQNIPNSNPREFPRAQTNQPGTGFNMARPEICYQVTTSTSSSKLNEMFNPQTRPTTITEQLEFAATVHEHPKFPVTHSQQFYATTQQRHSPVQQAVPSGDPRNVPNLSRSKTLEEEIEELLAFGAQLELQQKTEAQPPGNQRSIHDHRRPLAEADEPFVYANRVNGRSDIYQNPIIFTEKQKQMLQVSAGTQVPTSMNSQVLNPQPVNGAVSANQSSKTEADIRHSTGTNNLNQRLNQQPMKFHDSPDQPIRTMTDIRLPPEAQIFNQLLVETGQSNGKLVEPTLQTKESQKRMLSQNLHQLSGFQDHNLFVQVSTPMNNQTFSNHVTGHEAVNQSRYMERKSPANQQLPGERHVIGSWNSEKDTSKYVTVAQVEQTPGKPSNTNGLPNHMERSGKEFQTRKPTGSESETGFKGFESLSSARNVEELWTGEGNHECVVLYSEDGRRVLIPKRYFDSTLASPHSVPSRGDLVTVQSSECNRNPEHTNDASRFQVSELGELTVQSVTGGGRIPESHVIESTADAETRRVNADSPGRPGQKTEAFHGWKSASIERQADNGSCRTVEDLALDSRITQQQVGQRMATAEEGRMIDRCGRLTPESYTVRRQATVKSLPSLSETGPLQCQQQRFGSMRAVKVSSGSLQGQQPSPNDVMQMRQFYSQNSDAVFESPSPAVLSPNQFATRLLGEISRTSSFSSSVTGKTSPSLSVDRSSGDSASSNRDAVDISPQYFMQCVTEAYKEWYKPDMAREDVVNFLKDKPPGAFIIRNSTSYAGDFALAIKVSEIPAKVQHKTGDNSEEFVRHFLIESKPSGIQLKGRSSEPVFASLTSFVFQHALTPLSLPHRLLLPINNPETISAGSATGSLSHSPTTQNTPKVQEETSSLLIYIGTVDLETMTGPEALEKAVSQVETQNTSTIMTTVVHFMLSSQGIVLTDTKRKLFFRRHYPLSCISYCGTDKGGRRWTPEVDRSKKNTERRIFGFVCRKQGSTNAGSPTFPDGNECHLLADYETGYPADSVVDLINKVLRENGYNVLK